MSFINPGRLQIFAHAVVYDKLGAARFKTYVDSLPIKGNENILDLGAGSGNLSQYLAQKLEVGGGKLICLDMSAAWLKIARQKLKEYSHVEYEVGDIFQSNLEDNSLDAVFIHFMLHDVEKNLQAKTVMAVAKKLKNSGKVFIKEPIQKSHGIAPAEIHKLMEAAGLKEIESRLHKSWRPTYAAVFLKTESAPC